MSLATMVVGPFVLLGRLWPRLAASPDGRIVAVTSGGMYAQRLPLDDLGYERRRRTTARGPTPGRSGPRWPWSASGPGDSAAHGIVANAMHPGWADTPGLEASLPGFRSLIGGLLRSPAEGADTIVWLAAAPEARATQRAAVPRSARPPVRPRARDAPVSGGPSRPVGSGGRAQRGTGPDVAGAPSRAATPKLTARLMASR